MIKLPITALEIQQEHNQGYREGALTVLESLPPTIAGSIADRWARLRAARAGLEGATRVLGPDDAETVYSDAIDAIDAGAVTGLDGKDATAQAFDRDVKARLGPGARWLDTSVSGALVKVSMKVKGGRPCVQPSTNGPGPLPPDQSVQRTRQARAEACDDLAALVGLWRGAEGKDKKARGRYAKRITTLLRAWTMEINGAPVIDTEIEACARGLNWTIKPSDLL
jgi:hypothetical protein